MPIIRNVLLETQIAILQSTLRSSAISENANAGKSLFDNKLVSNNLPYLESVLSSKENAIQMIGVYPVPTREVLQNKFECTQIRNNAVICTPCGKAIVVENVIANKFTLNNQLFVITGITRDNNGLELGFCDVIALDANKLIVTGTPVVAQTVSDVDGFFVMFVPSYNNHQIIAYKSGSPDVAGISLETIVPT